MVDNAVIRGSSYTLHPTSNEIIDHFKRDYYNLRRIRISPEYKGVLLTKGNSFVGIVQVKNDGTIQALEVNPNYRNKGIATWLMDYAENKLKANKLSVRKSNTAAINMYRKRGYSTYDETDNMLLQKKATKLFTKEANFMFRDILNEFEKNASEMTPEELNKWSKTVLDAMEEHLAEEYEEGQEKVAEKDNVTLAKEQLLKMNPELKADDIKEYRFDDIPLVQQGAYAALGAGGLGAALLLKKKLDGKKLIKAKQ